MPGAHGAFEDFVRSGFSFDPSSKARIARFHLAGSPDGMLRAIEDSTGMRIVESHGGRSSLVRQGDDPLDQSARTEQFDYHTDGLYLDSPPAYCALYCLDPGDAGIETVFVDSRDVIEDLRANGVTRAQLKRWQQSYINRRGSKTTYDILSEHPYENFDVMQYSCGKGGIHLAATEPDADGDGMGEILDTFVHNAPSIKFGWTRGDLLIWDNHVYLHGRFGRGIDDRRKLLRFWIDHRN